MNNSVLQIIQQAIQSRKTQLSISNISLTTLPPEIDQLTNLTELWLSGNGITTLPYEIGQLISLTKLKLI